MSQRGSKFIAVAQIAEAILPVARGSKYEDPLDAALKSAGLGSVNGGGSLLDAQRQVASVDVEIALRDLDGALQFARATLLSLGAPAGSLLLFLRDGQPRALAVATGEEFDHQPALDALGRRMALLPVADDGDEEEERERAAAAAGKILKDFEGLWAGSYEYPRADLSACSADWLHWYDQVAQALAAHGFGFVADIATVRTDLQAPKHLGFSRKFLAASGITRVDAFRVATAKPKPPVEVVVLKSEFENGRYLSTSNTVLKWNLPDFIDAELLPPGSPAEAIAQRHAVRLAAYREATSAAAVRLDSLTELLAAEERERVRTRRFRQDQGMPSRVELERLGAAPGFAARVHEEMLRLKKI
ncbi:MAG TPA: hypothetical protein VGR92_07380 [Steroidobacteraceae bacterium]|nr:hypothetical protein [Steroidobacteraceae bacterium]